MVYLHRQDKLWDILQHTWLVLLKIVKNIKNEESLRKCHGQEESKKTWRLNIMWYLGWDPGKENQQ